ncbi:MAG: AAA family ATPase [Chloroflexota bacterium]|nr:AAA family ATPase [Chloroflexota bacterium]
MYLKTVTLRNFRCFEELIIKLHPRLTVLVAENGGGKTAILDGIAIGLAPILRYFSTVNQRLTGPGIRDMDFRLKSLVIHKGNEHWGASDYAQIVIETMSGLKWDNWRPSASGEQPQIKVGQKELSAYAKNILEKLKTGTPKLPVFAYYGANRGWIKIPKRLHESKVNYTYPTSALLDALDSLSDFKEMLKWFDWEEASELRAARDAQSENHEPPRKRHSALAVVRSAIDIILGKDYQNPRFNSKHKFVIDTENNAGELQISQLSQGYQSMLALSMDFAHRLALANRHLDKALQAPAIMLVDEIDLHLHPSWQQHVLIDLMRAFPKTQFIVTTHSPQVISTVPPESIRIIRDGRIYAAPPGTDGAEAQRILEDVFLVSPRPKMPMAEALDEYLRLVDERHWNSQRALELRQKLDSWSKGHEPRLLEADMIIDNLKWAAGQ